MARSCAKCRYHLNITTALKDHHSVCPFKHCVCSHCDRKRYVTRSVNRQLLSRPNKRVCKKARIDHLVPASKDFKERKPRSQTTLIKTEATVEVSQSHASNNSQPLRVRSVSLPNNQRVLKLCLILFPGQTVADALDQQCVTVPARQITPLLKKNTSCTASLAIIPSVGSLSDGPGAQKLEQSAICDSVMPTELMPDIQLISKMFPEYTESYLQPIFESCGKDFVKTLMAILSLKRMGKLKRDASPSVFDVIAYHLSNCSGCEACDGWYSGLPSESISEFVVNQHNYDEMIYPDILETEVPGWCNNSTKIFEVQDITPISSNEYDISRCVGEALAVLYAEVI